MELEPRPLRLRASPHPPNLVVLKDVRFYSSQFPLRTAYVLQTPALSMNSNSSATTQGPSSPRLMNDVPIRTQLKPISFMAKPDIHARWVTIQFALRTKRLDDIDPSELNINTTLYDLQRHATYFLHPEDSSYFVSMECYLTNCHLKVTEGKLVTLAQLGLQGSKRAPPQHIPRTIQLELLKGQCRYISRPVSDCKGLVAVELVSRGSLKRHAFSACGTCTRRAVPI